VLFLNQLFILFVLIVGETDSTKTTPNPMQNMDLIYLLTKPASGLSFSHPYVASLMQGWFVSNSPVMAGLLVPCFPQTQTKEPCLSSYHYPGRDKTSRQGILSPYKSQRKARERKTQRANENRERPGRTKKQKHKKARETCGLPPTKGTLVFPS